MPRRSWMRRTWLAALVVAGTAVVACTDSRGIDNPVVRKVAWFSYLDGGDIRAGCAEGALDSYRLVYNGRYEEQLRSYEITADGAGGAVLIARAKGPPNAFDVSLDDVLAPWRWQKTEARLSAEEFRQWEALLDSSGQFAGAPVGMRLFSGDFYWLGSACRDGAFHYHAWLFSDDKFRQAHFADFLFAHDGTGLAVNPPRRIPAGEYLGAQGRRKDQNEIRFWLQVGENGLGGVAPLF